MDNDKVKDTNMKIPIEKHETAAWDDTKETKPVSGVAIPSELGVRNAKEYVDRNEK